jgi:uncharacterized protein (TIGR02246 family)
MTDVTTMPGASEKAVVGSLTSKLTEAWAEKSADAFAAIFTDDATVVLPGGIYLKDNAEIRAFMGRAYQGPYRGTGVLGAPLGIRFIDTSTAVMVTEGGVTQPGADEVAPEDFIRATWVCVKIDGEWKVSAYQNSRVNLPS